MKYLMPMARNTVTGETVKSQDLTGRRFAVSDATQVGKLAERLALDLTARTRVVWRAVVKTYSVT